jgi:16S rRNA G966 N2-methylase RsmD
MRVITGTARGRRLIAPQGTDTRPTSDRVKEAIFSIIQFEIEQADVLDLFAGSGQLGIEALSRGARTAVFVDSAREAQEAIRANLAATGLAERARIVAGDAAAYLTGTQEKFDILLLDPPYRRGSCRRFCRCWKAECAPGASFSARAKPGKKFSNAWGAFAAGGNTFTAKQKSRLSGSRKFRKVLPAARGARRCAR